MMIRYSVLRYSPSTVSGEAINLGVLFSEEESGYREFRYTKKFSRIAKFDDTINISKVKDLLKGIKEDVDPTLFSDINFSIDKYVRYYINDYRFDSPKSIEFTDLEATVERIFKTYLKFDYPVAERPTQEDDKRFLYDLIKNQGVTVSRNEVVLGQFNERIRFDIVTDNTCIKIFNYDNKDLSRSIDAAKSWAWTCKYGLKDHRKPIVMYRYNEEVDDIQKDHENFSIISNIFKNADAEFIDLESGIERIGNIS